MRTSRDPRAERTRAAGVDAALTILEREGVAALTHVNLARESGIGRSTLYRHWPTTTDLILDLLNTFRMPDFRVVPGTLRERLAYNLDLQSTSLYDPGYRLTYQAVQSAALDPRVRERLVETNRSRVASVAAVISPDFDLRDDRDAVTEFLALMNGPLLQMATFVGPASTALRETVLDALIDYLLRAKPTAPPATSSTA